MPDELEEQINEAVDNATNQIMDMLRKEFSFTPESKYDDEIYSFVHSAIREEIGNLNVQPKEERTVNFHAFDFEDESTDEYFDSLDKAKEHVKKLYENGSRNLRIYVNVCDGEETEELGGIFFYGQEAVEDEKPFGKALEEITFDYVMQIYGDEIRGIND